MHRLVKVAEKAVPACSPYCKCHEWLLAKNGSYGGTLFDFAHEKPKICLNLTYENDKIDEMKQIFRNVFGSKNLVVYITKRIFATEVPTDLNTPPNR